MTEFFTMEPFDCGAYDPTTDFYGPRPWNVTIEYHDYYCVARNLYGVVLSVIACLGIVGNVFCLLILPKTGGSKSAIVMLVTLGMYDTIYLASGTLLKYLPSVTLFGSGPVILSNLTSPVTLPLILLSHMGAAYTTVAISVERCIAISAPLRVSQWLTFTRVKIVTVVILLFSLLYNAPRILLFAPTLYAEESVNATLYRLEPTRFATNRWLLFIYFGYFNSICKVVIPMLAVSLCNIILLVCLRRRRSFFAENFQTRSCSTRSSSHMPLTTSTSTSREQETDTKVQYPKTNCSNRYMYRCQNTESHVSFSADSQYHVDDQVSLNKPKESRRSENKDADSTCCDCGHLDGGTSLDIKKNQTSESPLCPRQSCAQQKHQSSRTTNSGKDYLMVNSEGNSTGRFNQKNSQGEKGHGHKRNETRVTSMVLAVTWTFLISQVFSGAQVIILLTGAEARCGMKCVTFNQICDLVSVLVSSTNFLLYYAFGQRFRRMIRSRLACLRRSGKNANESREIGRGTRESWKTKSTRQSTRCIMKENRILNDNKTYINNCERRGKCVALQTKL